MIARRARPLAAPVVALLPALALPLLAGALLAGPARAVAPAPAAVPALALVPPAVPVAAPAAIPGDPLDDPLPDMPASAVQVRLAPRVTGLVFPTDVEPAPDGSGRLFVTQVDGLVHVVEGGALLSEPFLDFSADYFMSNGSAMSSVAFHPDFASNRKLYVITTEKQDPALADFGASSNVTQQSVLYEVAAQASWPAPGCNLVDPTATRELLRINELNPIHNLDDLAFGADGYLYVAKGDDRNGGQNLTTIHGTVLRLDVDLLPGNAPSANGQYAIPADNPFVGAGGGQLGEIWAYGFRNPWRLSVDGDDVWVADVGEDHIEEIVRVQAGGNHGWSAKEGSFAYLPGEGVSDDLSDLPPGPFVDPVGEYDHGQGDRSLSGGVIYRGQAFPDLVGHYVCGDWISGRLLHMDPDTGAIASLPVDPSGDTIHGQLSGAPKEGVISVNADADGELLVVVTEREPVPTARVLRVEAANWFDLGHALAGAAGAPSLLGAGRLAAGTTASLTLSGAAPFAPTTIVWGAGELGLPFKGGVMVPQPDILTSALTTSAAGGFHVSGQWPAGIPSGLSAYFQVWIADPTGPLGWTASNGVRGVTE